MPARFSARLAAFLAITAAALGIPPVAAADNAPPTVTIAMTDTGFTPAAVTVAAGGSVTWKNEGSGTHTATTVGGAPSSFNTAGIGTGQSATLAFTVPGQYYYTSATDCLNNVNKPDFPCTISFLITVLPPGGQVAPAPIVPVPPSPAPAIAPIPPSGPAASATVAITDAGISLPNVTIALNGSVTWMNKGANVHTATTNADTIANSMPPFDTGGLASGQSGSVGFSVPGTYTYVSSPDCLSRSNPGAFNCGPYTVVVAATPVSAPQTSQPVAPVPAPAIPSTGNMTITIDDVNGFQPNQLTVKVGQTVSWVDVGNNAHSVVLNQNPTPSAAVPWWLPYQLPSVGGVFFDSGGIGPKETYNYTFNTPGTFPYHSSTEPIYQRNNSNCGCTLVTYQFFGTVTVTP